MSALLVSTSRYMQLAFGKANVSGDAHRRFVRILRGIFSGLLGRGVAVIVSFVSVPLTVRYLGAERYGAWVTISTAMAWIALADFGLSSSLTNAVSEGYASGNREQARSFVASAFWSLGGVAVLLSVVFFAVWRFVPWARVFNVHSTQAQEEIGLAAATAFATFVISFPFSIIPRIYGAYQETAVANGWAAAGSVLSLVALVLATRLRGGLVFLILAVSGAALLTSVISAVWLFRYSKPWLFPTLDRVKWPAIKQLTSLGGMFFVIQIAGVLLFQTDNLIIAHYLGAAAVTPYSVAWRLFTYTAVFQILAMPSYWPAYAEAFARGDREWIRHSFRLNFGFTLVSTFALALPLVLFGRWIIQKWAGSAAVPSNGLLVWMGVWSLISGAMASQACLLASSGRVKRQAIYSVAAAGVNLVLSIILVQKMGVTGAIIGTIGAYLTRVVVPQSLEVEHAMR